MKRPAVAGSRTFRVSKPLSMGSFLMERISGQPLTNFLQHILSGCQVCDRHLCSAYNIEDCEGWWLSGCHGSVAEHWRLKPEVPWVRLPVTADLFTFLYFYLITSKFLYNIMGSCTHSVEVASNLVHFL